MIIWDEICTVPRPMPKTFLDWLEHRGIQVVCCSDHGQPLPIAGDMPHDCLQQKADYYEEVEIDHRAKDPTLRTLKSSIRLQPDKVQCQEMRKALPGCHGWDRFIAAWKPGDSLDLETKGSRSSTGAAIPAPQGPLPRHPVPLYHPKDSR